MKTDFVTFLRCPALECPGDGLQLRAEQVDTIQYKNGPAEEVRVGSLLCGRCGRSYPIEGYVPSFEQLYPNELRREAEYWSNWYGFMWQNGRLGYFDLSEPRAPLITEGIEAL